MERSKRELILDAALEMFVNNGFENSPTSKIAKEAGVATGTLFHYFKTKEDLINELYLETKKNMVYALKKDLSKAVTLRQKIECIWYNAIKWGLDISHYFFRFMINLKHLFQIIYINNYLIFYIYYPLK